jgi:ABC-type bacteriocin/lantibiotic exporter with double-glycine peptidase domain
LQRTLRGPGFSAGWLLCLALCGCNAYTGGARDVTPDIWKYERGWVAVDNVPLFKQRGELDCGPTALAMVLAYWKVGVPGERWQPGPGETRVSAGELRDHARSLGLAAFVVEGGLDDIKHELSAGRPVIVGVAKPTVEGDVAHYEVVVGLHTESKRIATLDPAAGWRQNSLEGFLHEWIPTGRVLLIVAPAQSGAVDATHDATSNPI